MRFDIDMKFDCHIFISSLISRGRGSALER
jgi:hypothetical protein